MYHLGFASLKQQSITVQAPCAFQLIWKEDEDESDAEFFERRETDHSRDERYVDSRRDSAFEGL